MPTSIDQISTLWAGVRELLAPVLADHQRRIAKWAALGFADHNGEDFQEKQQNAGEDEPLTPLADIDCPADGRHQEELGPASERQTPANSPSQGGLELG